MTITDIDIHLVEDAKDVRACFPLMSQLRPHLADAEEFIARWQRLCGDGYRLLALRDEGHVVALSGFRVQENLVHGRFLYVDDLVTDESLRGKRYGERLMSWLKQEAQKLSCKKLVLDTPLSNSLGHRFYFRNGLLATSLRFNTPIET